MKAGFPKWSILFLTILAAPLGFQASASPIQLVSSQNASLTPTKGGNGDSGLAIISPDGRYVLFSSAANNLALTVSSNPIPILIPARINVYLRDRTNQTTILVSVNLAGDGGNGDSFAAGISSNGQYAVFESSATDLASGDTNNATDVFVRDVVNGTNIWSVSARTADLAMAVRAVPP